ncbi:hypothetical protein [Mesorhizobium sp. B2-6-2]|uniref:hypothetical protein n=1 Tax=Mesorhizobium sp. B2-6-2 TaxID=2589915 RepID=UPI001FEE60A3|nr:hypothetical protein [Mesorhizobium sp. B2-6-2]
MIGLKDARDAALIQTAPPMAGVTLAVLPPLVLFVFLRRLFVGSIVGSAIKG